MEREGRLIEECWNWPNTTLFRQDIEEEMARRTITVDCGLVSQNKTSKSHYRII
jgi:hypothetical protein